MAPPPDFDIAAAHRHFAAACFNRAWDLIEKPDRTPEEEHLMVALSQASIYHWLNRPDCGRTNLSVGYWQASRIQAILGHADKARRLGEICLEYSRDLGPFHQGYAHEALARAACVAGDHERQESHLAQARTLASRVEPEKERDLLLKDLDSLM